MHMNLFKRYKKLTTSSIQDPGYLLLDAWVKCRKITHGYCTLKIAYRDYTKWGIAQNGTKCTQNNTDSLSPRIQIQISYTCLPVSSQQDRKKYIATVASIFNQQQQAISILTFTQNRHCSTKDQVFSYLLIRNGSTVTYVTSSIFIAKPTCRFYLPVQNWLCLY